MPRRSDDDDILSLLGRKRTGLSINDVADAVAGPLKQLKADLVGHVRRMFELERLRDTKSDDRIHNLHARITAIESELRRMQKGSR